MDSAMRAINGLNPPGMTSSSGSLRSFWNLVVTRSATSHLFPRSCHMTNARSLVEGITEDGRGQRWTTRHRDGKKGCPHATRWCDVLNNAFLTHFFRYQSHTHQDTEGDTASAESEDRLKDCEDYQYPQNNAGSTAEA